MKIKALREIDSKQFLEIINIDGFDMVFTSELLRPLNPDATVDIVREYYQKVYPDFDLDIYELVEFELIETSATKLTKL